MAEIIIPANLTSSEIGVPSKGGALKIYYDARNYAKAKRTIDNALKLHKYAYDEYKKLYEADK